MNYSKEDIKAIKEPTLLQTALDIEEEDTEEDEEIDEQEELELKLRAAGLVKRRGVKAEGDEGSD